ncbi:MAG: transglutaminase-like cysteine peptidase [Dongiaceae bacterium]
MDRLPRRQMLRLMAASAGLGIGAAAAYGPGTALALNIAGDDHIGDPPPVYPGLFGSTETAFNDTVKRLPKAVALARSLEPVRTAATDLQSAEADFRSAKAEVGFDPARAGPDRWVEMIDGLRGADRMTQLEEVNRFANEMRYISDRSNYQVEDYWATPAEFFAKGGDCEDFALTKFVSLHRLGYNEDRLRIALATDERRRLYHAVLVVYLRDDAYVLDNQIKRVTPHREITHYRPLASFNSRRLWLHRV